jgi:hypothetical protein
VASSCVKYIGELRRSQPSNEGLQSRTYDPTENAGERRGRERWAGGHHGWEGQRGSVGDQCKGGGVVGRGAWVGAGNCYQSSFLYY